MDKQTKAEVHILDRLLYLLEERSVLQVAQHDAGFYQFIGGLYQQIDAQIAHCRPAQ